MVVSNPKQPVAGKMTTYEVAGSAEVRTTRPPVASGRDRFDELIAVHSREQGVSPVLVKAVIQVESGFNPSAVSPRGALGLMQLMPATARELGVHNPFHPEQNIRGGVTYLKRLLDMYDQDVTLALAAYNAGPGSVAKYGTVPPYRETRDYVRRITRAAPPPPAARPAAIYKWIDFVNGRPVPRYANTPPEGRAYEVITER
jgi:soluble lytic murein transglycosylase-like protein